MDAPLRKIILKLSDFVYKEIHCLKTPKMGRYFDFERKFSFPDRAENGSLVVSIGPFPLFIFQICA